MGTQVMLSLKSKFAIPFLLAVFCLSVASVVNGAEPDYSSYIGYDQYNWQFDHTSTTLSSTYIYVNTWDGLGVIGCDGTAYGTSHVSTLYWDGSTWVSGGSSTSSCVDGRYNPTYFFMAGVSTPTSTSRYWINTYGSIASGTQAYASFYWDASDQTAYHSGLDGYQQYTGTRVTQWISPYNEAVLATSTSYGMHFTYLFTEADYDLADNATNKLTWVLSPPIFKDEEIQINTFEVPWYSTELNAGGTLSLTATGTYYLSVSLYTEYDTDDWWNPFDNGETEIIQRNLGDNNKTITFYVGEPTTQEEYDEWHAIQDERYQQADNNIIFTEIKSVLDMIKMSKPQGYAFLLYDIISATTSTTTTLSMTLTGATGTPLFGKSLTLDASQASDDAITLLNSDGMYDKFMSFWTLFWYVMLGIFILREVFGGFTIERELIEEKPKTYIKRGFVRGVRSTRSSGGTNIPIKKG